MSSLPQHAPPRAARIQLGEGIPAVLRSADGGCEQAALRTVSLTGGLLRVHRDLNQGSCQRLVFITHTGPVFGTAEMLNPVGHNLQPFRFVSLHQNDKRRLGAAIQSCLEPAIPVDADQDQWIEKYRSAISERNAQERHPLRKVLYAITLATCSLAGILYLFQHVK